MPRNSQQRRPKKNVSTSQLLALADRTVQLSDQSVMTPQDAFEIRPISNTPPSSVPKAFSKQGYWYRGQYTASQFTTNTAVPTGYVLSFALSSCYQASTLTTLFDQYCIVRAIVRTSVLNNTTNTTTGPGDYVTVIDHDDVAGLTTKSQAQAYTTALTTPGLLGQTRIIQPRYATAAYSGSLFNAFSNTRGYIDSGSPSVPHYGMKIVADPSSGSAYTYNIEVELYVHFRDTRA